MLNQLLRKLIAASVVVALCLVSPLILSIPGEQPNSTFPSGRVFAQDAIPGAAPPEVAAQDESPAPHADKSYAGTNQCFICHRPQTNTWSETKHAHAFTDVPEKYRDDPACLKCHVTGFGEPGGYVTGTAKDLLMVGCESCHGPGAQHIDAAQRFVLATTDTAEIEQEMRDTIVKTPTDSVCMVCHIVQAHQSHPAYDGRVSPRLTSEHVVPCPPIVPCMPIEPCGPWSTYTPAPVRYASSYSVKTCGSCHYDQYQQWSAGKHADLSTVLPAKYGNDPACQQCHPKGGAVANSATIGSDSQHDRIGAACESCHGPALEHVRFTRQYIHLPRLGPKLEQVARDAIRKGKPASTCVQCHLGQSHQTHPQFEEQ